MTRSRRISTNVLLALSAGSTAVVLAATPAGAHAGRAPDGILEGVLHPVTGPDHLLAMVAVGVVAVLAAPHSRVWVFPTAFLGGMTVGGAAGLAGVPLPGAELLIIASVFVLGLAIVLAAQGSRNWPVIALIVAGVAHGHAHGAEAPTSVHPIAYVAGFVLATAALHLAGVGLGMAVRSRHAARVGVGAATVAAGALLLA